MKKDIHQVLNSPRQKWSAFLHRTKARFKRAHKGTVAYLGNYISPSDTIFDIGANFGYFAKEFSRLHGQSCNVLCFEPVTYNYNILKDVTRKMGNVRIEKLAFSNKEGEMEISIPIKETGKLGPALAHFGPEQARDYISEFVPICKMDDYVARHGIKKIDFIKVDVEGAEILVFEGANNVLATHKPGIFCEVNDSYAGRIGRRAQDVFDLLKNHGYTAYLTDCKTSRAVDAYDGPGDYIFIAGK